jgi:hypothetical protein
MPGQVEDAIVDDFEPPTICFAHTARLQVSEVVHVQSPQTKSKPASMFSQLVPSLGGSSSNAVSKINE